MPVPFRKNRWHDKGSLSREEQASFVVQVIEFRHILFLGHLPGRKSDLQLLGLRHPPVSLIYRDPSLLLPRLQPVVGPRILLLYTI